LFKFIKNVNVVQVHILLGKKTSDVRLSITNYERKCDFMNDVLSKHYLNNILGSSSYVKE